jgi:hypothetical protein
MPLCERGEASVVGVGSYCPIRPGSIPNRGVPVGVATAPPKEEKRPRSCGVRLEKKSSVQIFFPMPHAKSRYITSPRTEKFQRATASTLTAFRSSTSSARQPSLSDHRRLPLVLRPSSRTRSTGSRSRAKQKKNEAKTPDKTSEVPAPPRTWYMAWRRHLDLTVA